MATAGIAKPVKRSSFIEERSHVFRRRNIENVLSAEVKKVEFATETLCLDRQKDDTQSIKGVVCGYSTTHTFGSPERKLGANKLCATTPSGIAQLLAVYKLNIKSA